MTGVIRSHCSLQKSEHERIAISLFCLQKKLEKPKSEFPTLNFTNLWSMLIINQKYKLAVSAKSAKSSAIFYFFDSPTVHSVQILKA